MLLPIELFLEIVINNHLTLSDLKKLCKTNKHYFNICKYDIKYIFKTMVEHYNLRNSLDFIFLKKYYSDYELLKIYFNEYFHRTDVNFTDQEVTTLPLLPNVIKLYCGEKLLRQRRLCIRLCLRSISSSGHARLRGKLPLLSRELYGGC